MLVLASGSPQRRAILEQLGIEFRVQVPEVEELAAGEPEALVTENALRKARAVEGEMVLGVDTVVVAGDEEILGKPDSEEEARASLERLGGGEHEVWSGFALIDAERVRTGAVVTLVRFRQLGSGDIDHYLASGEWKGRAGGYAIQARGATLVERIEGDYLNVVGLPVAELLRVAPELTKP